MRYQIIIALLALVTSTVVRAEQKIGFIDAQRILKNAPQVVLARQDLDSQFEPRREKLQALGGEIEALQKKILDDQGQVSEQTTRQEKAALLEMQRNYTRMENEIAEDMNLQRNLVLRDLQKLVSDEVLRIAEEEGYDLIVQDVVFASKRIDITDQVLEVLKERAK